MTVRCLFGRRRQHLTESADPVASQQALAVHPQQLAELVGVVAIRFTLRSLVRLNQHHLAAAVFREHFQLPVVEPANLDDDREPCCPSVRLKLREELTHLLPARAHLSLQQNVSSFVT